MIIKQSISLLVPSAILVLPTGITQAGSVNVQTGNMQTTIHQDRGVKVKNGSSTAIINRERTSPNYHGKRLNSRLKLHRHPGAKRSSNQYTCNGGSYSSQSNQTTVSSQGVSRTRSSQSKLRN